MLQPSLQEALNAQLNEELYASLLYLSLAAYLDGKRFHGMAAWMRTQAADENDHARRFYQYLVDRGGRVTIKGMPAPPTEWPSPRVAFESALAHEQHLTEHIGGLAELARSSSDHASYSFLQWFVSNQAQEESRLRDLAAQLARVGEDGTGLLLIDRNLGGGMASAD